MLTCPSPEEYHRNIWNLKFGGGGNFLGTKTTSFSSFRNPSVHSYDTSSTNLEDFDVALPLGVSIPNPIFARKFGMVPEGQPLPQYISDGQMQLTADDVLYDECERLWDYAWTKSGADARSPGDLPEVR